MKLKKNEMKTYSATLFLILYDLTAVALSYFFALWFRFDGKFSEIPLRYLTPYMRFIPFYAVFCVIIFWFFKLYKSIWKYVGDVELLRLICATAVTGGCHIVFITLFLKRMPLSYYFFGVMFQFLFTLAVRFGYRFYLILRKRYIRDAASCKRVMLIGAGEAGRAVIREIQRSEKINEIPVCVIDDDETKWNRSFEGIPVVGGRESILLNVEKYRVEKIYFAIPTAGRSAKRDILSICNETTCELKSLPGIYQIARGDVSLADMKEVAIEDLLGRDQVQVDMGEIFKMISGKVVLITGGGGSIGSEIALQVARHDPKQLIIFDIYENNAYEVQHKIQKEVPDCNLTVLIGSVRDSRRIEDVFREYRPDLVYHAAAHKHVPLMEDSPCEAIKNNVIGTYKTAYAAMRYGAQRFVLISTDKAVNPTNVMGASKRLCELVIQAFDKKIKEGKAEEIPWIHVHEDDMETHGYSKTAISESVEYKDVRTEYTGVRFGNVLNSSGSVVPLFKEQIANGGPVTVTHPDIIRYFMTIPEAASLVLQAGAYAKGGEIFVLDMGDPVKIDDLARNLIRLSGLEPDEDIEIEYTGLRPGEKLFEEKLMSEEGLTRTPNDLIHIGRPIEFDEDQFLRSLDPLMRIAYKNTDAIRLVISDMVNTYRPTEEMTEEQKSVYRAEIDQILREVKFRNETV